MDEKEEVDIEDIPYLLHPYPATLVTTVGEDGKPNVMAVAWIMPVSVTPPYIAMTLRPQRHSYKLLTETTEFTVNIPDFNLAKQVVFCGRRSGRDYDKFKETGLTPMKARTISASIIKECIAHLECKLEKVIEVHDHILCIGKVMTAYASNKCYRRLYDLSQHQPLLHLRGNTFTTTTRKSVEYSL
ncbi:MAG: flavin reductase family protein [Candidatus Bathyarchaeota archaeon]|nr:flavin reductase family protein [Candidatus Bathyarchaeota archaeon]